MCSVQGWPHWLQGGLIGSRGGTIGRTGGCLGPFMRRLTPQVVAQAGRPHCHLSGPAAQERVCVAAADWACRSRIGFAFADRLGACG